MSGYKNERFNDFPDGIFVLMLNNHFVFDTFRRWKILLVYTWKYGL